MVEEKWGPQELKAPRDWDIRNGRPLASDLPSLLVPSPGVTCVFPFWDLAGFSSHLQVMILVQPIIASSSQGRLTG